MFGPEGRNRWVWGCWVVLLAVVLVRFVQTPHRTIECYREGSLAWVNAQPLYDDYGVGFLYAPHAAVLYAPFALLSPVWGHGLWRIVNLGVFAWGAWRMTRLTPGTAQTPLRSNSFALISLLAIPLSLGSALNGQFNLVMAGLMMLTVAQVVEGRWWQAALALWLAVLLKPLAIVLLLLLLPFYPALLCRMLASIPLVLVFPYLAQSPEYVTSQYVAFAENLKVSSSQGDVRLFAHIFSTLSLLGLEVPHSVRNILRVVLALVTFLLCRRAHRQLAPAESGFFILALSVVYVLVFNPRTEGLTYAILGPILGAWAALAIHQGKSATWVTWGVVPLTVILMLVNYELGRVVAPGRPAVLFTPVAGCLCFVGLCIHILQRTQLGDRADDPVAPANAVSGSSPEPV